MKPRLKPIQAQTVVLAGATSGIGLETALMMAEKGARVVILGRDQDGLNDAVNSVRNHVESNLGQQSTGNNGHAYQESGVYSAEGTSNAVVQSTVDVSDRVIGIQADVTNFEQLKSAADEVVQRFERIDTWVNVAAVSEWALFEDTSPAEFHRIIEVNLLGQAYGAMAALPYLKQQAGGGALIFIASIAGRAPIPYQSAYNASKHGILGLVETMRLEMKHTEAPVSVTAIVPASINTPLFEKSRTKLGVEPEPLKPIYDVHLVAEAITYAAQHPVRELIVGDSGYMITFMRRLAPTLTNNYLGASGFRQQISNEQKSVQAPDNMYTHLSGYDQPEGSQAPVKRFSILTWFSTHPRARMALYGGLIAGVGALIGWRLVGIRRERRSWRYQLPRRAKKISREAGKTASKVLHQAGTTLVALPVVSNLPGVSNLPILHPKRNVFQRLGDTIGKWGAALLALQIPFLRRRRSMMDQITRNMPFVGQTSRQKAMLNQISRQSGKLSKQVKKRSSKAARQVNRTMEQIDDRRVMAMKAIVDRMPSKNEMKQMAEKQSIETHKPTLVERLPFVGK